MKTSCFIGWFHRFDHSSNNPFENCFLKIAVPKFSKYIIRETTTVLAKKSCKGVLVLKRLTTGLLVENTWGNSYKIVTEISEENRVNSLTGSE